MIECYMVSLHIYEFMIIDCVHLWHKKSKNIAKKVNNSLEDTRLLIFLSYSTRFSLHI